MRDDSNPKLCECGCGNPAPIAKRTKNRIGHVKGEPVRFIHGHHARGVVGPRHNQWKTGRIHVKSGHVLVNVGFAHPMADNSGYCGEHRIVLATALGRMLAKTESVHHIDLNPANNTVENLIVLSRSEHMRLHGFIRHRGVSPIEAIRLATDY